MEIENSASNIEASFSCRKFCLTESRGNLNASLNRSYYLGLGTERNVCYRAFSYSIWKFHRHEYSAEKEQYCFCIIGFRTLRTMCTKINFFRRKLRSKLERFELNL